MLGQEAQSRTLRPVVKIVVDVMLKPEIHDPQGEAIAGACHRLGFGDVVAVRQGKRFEVELTEADPTGSGGTSDAAAAQVAQIASELLANPVIEEYAVRVG
jgi:phosphoribosylformylglycinamidine synthase PurS subunit